MDTLVFAAVLAAAFLHAAWNAALKLGLDRFSSVILLAVVQALIAIPILPFVTQPLWAAWPWILASVALPLNTPVEVEFLFEVDEPELS